MLKERYVRNMQHARTSIVRQLYSVKLLVSGLDIKKSHFTSKLTDTPFGEWFYNEAVLFRSEKSRCDLDEIEKSLLTFHEHFSNIYAIYYGKQAGGLLGLFGIKRKPTPEQKAEAQRLYEEMVPLSDHIRQQVNHLETILNKMPTETLSTLSPQPQKRLMTA